MITKEEQQLNAFLAIDEITFAIPAQSFDISCSISAEEALPVVTEFALRITHVCGLVSPVQLQNYFGYSEKETAAVVKALLDERLIQWHEDQLELTPYSKARFQDSSDDLPRFFRIQEWTGSVVFDLISFSPAERPSRLRRIRSMIELTSKDTEKLSRSIQCAERSFQTNFRQISKKDRAEIYKISDVDAGELFSIPLPCIFQLNFDGHTSIQREISDESFGGRLEMAEAISDAMVSHDQRDNDFFENFIAMFDDELLKGYIAKDEFDLRKYVQDVHLTKVNSYSNSKVIPLLGALHLKKNRDILVEWLTTWTTSDLPTSNGEGDSDMKEGKIDSIESHQKAKSALWLAPQSRLWSRSPAANELLQIINRIIAPKDDGEVSLKVGGVRTLLQIERGDNGDKNRAAGTYKDIFPKLFATTDSIMGGNFELFLFEDKFMCALFHFHIAHHPVTVPIGFFSSLPGHLEAAKRLVSKQILNRGNIVLLNGVQNEQVFNEVNEFSFLQKSAITTKPILTATVKKSSNTITLRKNK
ncbi:MAG: hypothetical protein Q7K26_06480 [bacterium]|nr:hypothetical protein [bacterium]